MKESLLAFLKQLRISPAAVIPLSAKRGDNVARRSEAMPWYEGPTLCEELDALVPVVSGTGPLRLPVQDVYPWVEGGIAVGRLESGGIRAGASVIIEPGGRPAVVRKIRKFMDEVGSAEAGECVGVALEGGAMPGRGDVLCDPEDRPLCSTRFRANVFWLDQRPFRIGEPLTIRLATREAPCRIEEIDERLDSSTLEVIENSAGELAETEVGRVVMEAGAPMAMEQFSRIPELGRFVLERGMSVAAGGTVIAAL